MDGPGGEPKDPGVIEFSQQHLDNYGPIEKRTSIESKIEEEVDNQVRRISEEMFQLRIGKAIVYSLAKRNKLHWIPEEVEKAFSTETLSIVADGWLDDITDARRKMSSVFKKLSA